MKKDLESFSTSLDNLENEEWIDALGFDGIYEVSNYGRVKTLAKWVSSGKSERLVKERIRKLHIGKDGRTTMLLYHNNIGTSVNLPALIFFSFNPNKEYLNNTFCIMHKNKIQYDNRLSNLELTTVSKSHKINHSFNLLPHLKIENEKRKLKYQNLTHKTCKKCNTEKSIEFFEFGRNTCLECRKSEKQQDYIKRKSKPS